MKKYIIIMLLCIVSNSCLAQKQLRNSYQNLLEKVYQSQLAYYNDDIKDKDNYASILDFAKQKRSEVIQQAKSIIQSKNFIVLEGFSPAWGNYIGFIWNNKSAYLYQRFANNKKFHIAKIKLTDNRYPKNTSISPFLINKINNWDIKYIDSLKKTIGASVLDGYNFIATKVTTGKANIELQTIAFEQFSEGK